MSWYELTYTTAGALISILFLNKLMQVTCQPVIFLKYRSDFKAPECIHPTVRSKMSFPSSFPIIPISLHPLFRPHWVWITCSFSDTHCSFHHRAFYYLPSALSDLASSAWLLQNYLFIFLEITQMLLPLISSYWKHSHFPWCSHSTLFIIHFELKFIINNKWLFHLLDYKSPEDAFESYCT